MKTLFLILFFGRSFLLTPEPVTIGETWVELTPKKPLSAITSGAALYVDVTQETGFVSITGGLEKIIPKNTVTAELIPESGAPIKISNHWSAHSKDEVRLILAPENGRLPTDIKFKAVKIRSMKPIRGAKVIWKNYTL